MDSSKDSKTPYVIIFGTRDKTIKAPKDSNTSAVLFILQDVGS